MKLAKCLLLCCLAGFTHSESSNPGYLTTYVTPDKMFDALIARIDHLEEKQDASDRLHHMEIAKLSEDHYTEIARLRHDHEKEITKLRHEHDAEIGKLRHDHQTVLDEVRHDVSKQTARINELEATVKRLGDEPNELMKTPDDTSTYEGQDGRISVSVSVTENTKTYRQKRDGGQSHSAPIHQGHSDGCGRVPATPSPTISPTPTEPTINGTVRSYACTKGEVNKTKCLNGGTCFVYILQSVRVPSCHCTSEYRGSRCQELNIDALLPSISQNRIRRNENDVDVAFFATLSVDTHHIGTNQPVAFDHVVTNHGNSYNPHVGVFVAPVSGTYVFAVTLMTGHRDQARYGMFRNLEQITYLWVNGAENDYDTTSQTAVLHLAKGDDVMIKHTESDHSLAGSKFSMFSGFLLSQDFTDSSPIVGK